MPQRLAQPTVNIARPTQKWVRFPVYWMTGCRVGDGLCCQQGLPPGSFATPCIGNPPRSVSSMSAHVGAGDSAGSAETGTVWSRSRSSVSLKCVKSATPGRMFAHRRLATHSIPIKNKQCCIFRLPCRYRGVEGEPCLARPPSEGGDTPMRRRYRLDLARNRSSMSSW